MNIHFQKPRCSPVFKRREGTKRLSGSHARLYAWSAPCYSVRHHKSRPLPLRVVVDTSGSTPRRNSSNVSLHPQDSGIDKDQDELSIASTQPTLASTTTGVEDEENRDDKTINHASSRRSREGNVGRDDIPDTIMDMSDTRSQELTRQMSDDELTQEGSFDQSFSVTWGSEAFMTPLRNPATPEQQSQDTDAVIPLPEGLYTPILSQTSTTRRILPSDSFWKNKDNDHDDNDNDLPCNEHAFEMTKQGKTIKPIWRERSKDDGTPSLEMLNYFPKREESQDQLPYFPFDEMVSPLRNTDTGCLSMSFIQELSIPPLVPHPMLGYSLDVSKSISIATPRQDTGVPFRSSGKSNDQKSSNSDQQQLHADHDGEFGHNSFDSLVDEEDDEKTTTTTASKVESIMNASHSSWPQTMRRIRMDEERRFEQHLDLEFPALYLDDEDEDDEDNDVDEDEMEHLIDEVGSQATTVLAANGETEQKQRETPTASSLNAPVDSSSSSYAWNFPSTFMSSMMTCCAETTVLK